MDLFQLREKDLSSAALRALAGELVKALRGTRTRVLINGRPDIALIAGAHGVQLPEEGLPPGDVKAAFPSLLVGASCHSLAAAERAAEEGADFLLFGPVFPTPGKAERAVGTRALAEVVRALRVPVHAIGGIEADSVDQVWQTGCAGVAAIRAFLQEPLEAQVRRLRWGVGAGP